MASVDNLDWKSMDKWIVTGFHCNWPFFRKLDCVFYEIHHNLLKTTRVSEKLGYCAELSFIEWFDGEFFSGNLGSENTANVVNDVDHVHGLLD